MGQRRVIPENTVFVIGSSSWGYAEYMTLTTSLFLAFLTFVRGMILCRYELHRAENAMGK